MNTKLLMGYFPGWSQCSSGRSSILISGEDLPAMKELQNIFIRLAAGTIAEIELHAVSFIEPIGGIKVLARLSDVDRGIKKMESADSFGWQTTTKHWDNFAREIAVFRDEVPYGRHQYLDTDVNDGIDVEVSFCEYSPQWVKQVHAACNSRTDHNS